MSTIKSLGENLPGKLDVLVSSIEDIKTQAQAQSIIDSTSPTYIVFSAGAGGKGGPERTLAVDRDACIAFIGAAAATLSVSKFLLVCKTSPAHYFFVQADREHRDNVSVLPCSPRKDKD